MLRDAVMKPLDHDPHFTWRGGAVTRIENLSDIVFALALGMLVSSGAPPVTVTELGVHLWNIVPVAAGFALLLLIWNAHFTYFRRYGVADQAIIILNAALLLVVLFLAYPLRFIFDSLFGWAMMLAGDPSRVSAMQVDYAASGVLVAYFAVGYACVFLILSLMYSHALSHADRLALTPSEVAMTRRSIWSQRAHIVLSLAVVACALFTPMVGFAGALLGLAAPVSFLIRQIIRIPEQGEAPAAAT